MRRCDIRFSAGVGPASVLDLLTNGSFEVATGIGANAALAPGATNLVGWTVIGGGNLLWCDSSSYCDRSASQGTYSLDLTGLTNVSPYAGVEQAIATTPGVTYELTFDVAGRSDSMPVGVRATAGTTSALFSSGRDWSVPRATAARRRSPCRR